jgi:YegS/Rv2252/BmrU family lipid kinase
VKVAAIINPISGAGADARVANERRTLIAEVFDRRGLQGSIHFTERAGHARDLARAAVNDRMDLVIVWGGDGTVNEIGTALMGTSTALGLVPAGSGNGLAAALGCSRDPRTAIEQALDGRSRAIDAGMLGNRPFFNIAGIGVDARIAALFNTRARGSRGRWPYVLIGIREGCRYVSRDYELELDGDTRPVRALLIAFANGGEYGNGIKLCAGAELDDGLLDAMVVEERSVLARFWHARHLARGTPHRAPRVTLRRIRRAVVRTNGPIEYHVDGEPGVADDGIEIGVRPRALWVRV